MGHIPLLIPLFGLLCSATVQAPTHSPTESWHPGTAFFVLLARSSKSPNHITL
jgi:hypothetical protein